MTMKIEDVSLLARLRLSETEKELFTGQLERTIEYINKLNEIDTTGIEPTAHVLPICNVFREDRVRNSLPCTKVLQNAPDSERDFFKVPRIIE
jgi:aspartyl-tRNA(Asn)/glutamyl-tRNA(Gln) amidotransferase subunit C